MYSLILKNDSLYGRLDGSESDLNFITLSY